MGLDDIAGDVKKEVEQLDDDDIEELSGDIEEYMERVDRLSNVMTNMDSRMEQIREDMASVDRRLQMMEDVLLSEEEQEPDAGTETPTDTGDDTDASNSWHS